MNCQRRMCRAQAARDEGQPFQRTVVKTIIWATCLLLLGTGWLQAQPFITEAPQSQAVAPRTPVTLSVAVVSDVPVKYRWERNGRLLPVRKPVITFKATRLRAGTYRAIVRDAAGNMAVTEPAVVTVKPPPVILIQPRDTVVKEHATAVFQAVLNNSGPYTSIVWHNDNPREGSHQIPDTIGIDPHKTRLEIPNSLNVDYYNGIYWLAVTNEVGGTVSAKVILTVVP